MQSPIRTMLWVCTSHASGAADVQVTVGYLGSASASLGLGLGLSLVHSMQKQWLACCLTRSRSDQVIAGPVRITDVWSYDYRRL